MFEIIPVGAVVGGECYLLLGHEKTALIDSGFAFCGNELVQNLEDHLHDRPLDYILLTHSHYDHISGAPYVKARWPEAQIVASAHTARVLERSSAQIVLKEMNDNAAKLYGVDAYPPAPLTLHVDVTVDESDVLDFGDMTLEVIQTPGHTRCSIAFYSKEARLLIANETSGTLGDGVDEVIPCHLVGHQDTLDSIKKAASLEAESLLVPHHGVVYGDDVKRYFDAAAKNVERNKDLVVNGYKEGLDLDDLIALLKSTYYTETLAAYQPEAAFILNARHMVSMILREVLGVELP